jgi:epoxyqueuosine reductase
MEPPAPTANDTRFSRLRASITDKALAVGFDRVGFAPARIPASTARLEEWLDRGYHGEMSWMSRARERRVDASQSLPGALSLVCCALNYYQGPAVEPFPGTGTVSSYARGTDYHEVLDAKLSELAAFIEEEAGVATRVYVDTGPVLEKGFAVAAGLGWIGKHTNLISSNGSSWFFLGEILVPLDLSSATASPVRDHCGSCTRCIAACPTGAIVEPYVLDSRLCISYLTIELRGPIPRELRPLIGNRIYGCDDCQDVCPWNRFAVKSEESAFFPREPLASMDLVAILGMSREEFLDATRGSSIRRARYPGLLRNAAVALGNGRDPATLPALARALSHEEPLVRGHAAWALGAIGGGGAGTPLSSRLAVEEDPEVRGELEWALAQLDR